MSAPKTICNSCNKNPAVCAKETCLVTFDIDHDGSCYYQSGSAKTHSDIADALGDLRYLCEVCK